MSTFEVEPVAFVSNQRKAISDDNWGAVVSEITLADHIPSEAILNIELFSHLEIIYVFDRLKEGSYSFSGHPRENPEYPLMGIFAQRKKDRPNHIGLTTVKVLKKEERAIIVEGLDALDGTPVIDIKPLMKEFQVKEEIRQPAWVSDLMKNYW